MAQITVRINNREYEIACDDGQESHITQLAEFVDKRVNQLIDAVGQVGDARLLVMANLLVADELSEVCTELDNMHNKNREGGAPQPTAGLNLSELDQLASRIEKISESIRQY